MQRIFLARSMFGLMIVVFICSFVIYGCIRSCGRNYEYELQAKWATGDDVVSGKVFNKSNSDFSSVELTIEVLDENNEVLDSKNETILDIPAGSFRDFEVSMAIKDGCRPHIFVSKIDGEDVQRIPEQ